MPKLARFVLQASLLLGLTGCASDNYGLTHALWTHVDVRNFCMPAADPHLEIRATAEGDTLILYDELDEKRDVIQRRAYLLQPNRGRIDARKAPVFIDTTNASALPLLPILPISSLTYTSSPLPPVYATQSPTLQQFVIHRSGHPQSTNDLPFYPRNSGTFTKVALTPFAVAGDATVVGFFFGCVALRCWVPSYEYYYYEHR